MTTDGLRVFEALTEDQMMVLDLLGVTFVSVLPVSHAAIHPCSHTSSLVHSPTLQSADRRACLITTCVPNVNEHRACTRRVSLVLMHQFSNPAAALFRLLSFTAAGR